ncbi:hypothetical protein, partial [Escherichia coli]|uniref:hypothetical protein n=1 Tax=Escherichia coli TaxID=562 RepID=UPI001BC8C1A7
CDGIYLYISKCILKGIRQWEKSHSPPDAGHINSKGKKIATSNQIIFMTIKKMNRAMTGRMCALKE